jgi:hypothetical protein
MLTPMALVLGLVLARPAAAQAPPQTPAAGPVQPASALAQPAAEPAQGPDTSASPQTAATLEGAGAPALPAGEEVDPAALFRAATDALAGDRPTEAIAKLEALGDRGINDPVLSYDRGLAYAARIRAGAEQPGDLGRAAHGFEEARELSHDRALIADASMALAAVRAEVARRRARAGDPIELEHGVSLGRSIVKLLPENVWAMLAAACALTLACGIAFRAKATQRRLKVAATTTSSVAGGLLLVTSLILYSARDGRRHVREAVVIAANTRMLDDKHVVLAAAAALPEGARVQLLDESGDFAHVVAGRAEGWLPSGSVLPMAK